MSIDPFLVYYTENNLKNRLLDVSVSGRSYHAAFLFPCVSGSVKGYRATRTRVVDSLFYEPQRRECLPAVRIHKRTREPISTLCGQQSSSFPPFLFFLHRSAMRTKMIAPIFSSRSACGVFFFFSPSTLPLPVPRLAHLSFSPLFSTCCHCALHSSSNRIWHVSRTTHSPPRLIFLFSFFLLAPRKQTFFPSSLHLRNHVF